MAVQPVGKEVPIAWRGRRVRAFVPEFLADHDLDLDAATVARTATAAADLGHAAAELSTHDYEPLARMLLRAEGVASSFIEGVRAPLVDVVLAEQGQPLIWELRHKWRRTWPQSARRSPRGLSRR